MTFIFVFFPSRGCLERCLGLACVGGLKPTLTIKCLINKSFLVLFCKKERAFFLHPAALFFGRNAVRIRRELNLRDQSARRRNERARGGWAGGGT